eukprot:TRINITY_DN10390_c0_g1_i10.p2 TRINITY_DN10390_c0_g1~~TRINITY_DN10390_c0_g1_i10.p2  ORF type:complete len:119 (-),score=8.01 TRINITY_DN10390_c0_g1_i10:795-1151(-)
MREIESSTENFAAMLSAKWPEIEQKPRFTSGSLHRVLTLASNYRKPLLIFLYSLQQHPALPKEFLMKTICSPDVIKTLVIILLKCRMTTSSYTLATFHPKMERTRPKCLIPTKPRASA